MGLFDGFFKNDKESGSIIKPNKKQESNNDFRGYREESETIGQQYETMEDFYITEAKMGLEKYNSIHVESMSFPEYLYLNYGWIKLDKILLHEYRKYRKSATSSALSFSQFCKKKYDLDVRHNGGEVEYVIRKPVSNHSIESYKVTLGLKKHKS